MRLLWFLLGAAAALDCQWDRWEDQDLDLSAYSPILGSGTQVAGAEECKAACCSQRGCDAALVGAPQDGALQCYLVTCWVLGSDQCRPLAANSSQFQVHRRRQEGGSASLIRPLLGEGAAGREQDADEDGGESEELPLLLSKDPLSTQPSGSPSSKTHFC